MGSAKVSVCQCLRWNTSLIPALRRWEDFCESQTRASHLGHCLNNYKTKPKRPRAVVVGGQVGGRREGTLTKGLSQQRGERRVLAGDEPKGAPYLRLKMAKVLSSQRAEKYVRMWYTVLICLQAAGPCGGLVVELWVP